MALSDERLAEIRDFYANDHDVIGELLAEVERLREEQGLAAAVTHATVLAKTVLWWIVVAVVGVSVMNVGTYVLGWPWWCSFGASLIAGIPLGWWRNRWESSDAR